MINHSHSTGLEQSVLNYITLAKLGFKKNSRSKAKTQLICFYIFAAHTAVHIWMIVVRTRMTAFCVKQGLKLHSLNVSMCRTTYLSMYIIMLPRAVRATTARQDTIIATVLSERNRHMLLQYGYLKRQNN